MKRLTFGLLVLAIFFIGAFFWLLSAASPQHAPQEVQTIDLPDIYEK
jgi:cbb3-type cytochrome oxidase subunit 3